MSDTKSIPATAGTTQAASPLTVKLAEVMAAVSRIPKRGRNAYHGYQYATEADIADAVRDEFSKRQIVMYSAVTGVTQREGASESGKPQFYTDILMAFTLVDGMSGESREFAWAGAGQDRGEKGLYKAITGAEKYFLLKLLLIPTGDDPEDDSNGHATAKATTATAPTQTPAPATAKLDAPGLRVVDVERYEGKSKAGKPFVKFTVKFSDGQKGATFDGKLYEAAVYFRESGDPVNAVIENQGGYPTLTELHAVSVVDEPGVL